ncbi:hypothetical protein GGF38_001412, partial [Coemansia sp. RSA 25]
MRAADSLPPTEDNAAVVEAGSAWHEAQGIAQAIEEAMSVLGQERKNGFGLANADDDIDVDILSEDDDGGDGMGTDNDGMTREIMGPEYTENLTLSRVDFDQWMANHAELDESAAADEEEEEEEGVYEHVGYSRDSGPPGDVRDKWQADRQAWSFQNRALPEQVQSASGFGTEDDPITIESSDVDADDDGEEEEEEYGEDEEADYDEEREESVAFSGDEDYDVDEYNHLTSCPRLGLRLSGSDSNSAGFVNAVQTASYGANDGQYFGNMECERIQCADPSISEYDHAATVANAMLFLNGGLEHTDTADDFAKATEPMSPPLSGYQRPPLPPPPAHSSAPSLAEMHKAIGQSIDRSLTIVDEIAMCCDTAGSKCEEGGEEACADIITPASSANGQDDEEIVRVFEVESQDSIELARQAIERLHEFQGEAASKQNALNTQIFKLSAELFQTTSDKATLESAIKRLERDNGEYAQTIDDLQQQMETLRSASSGEIEGLKERVRHVASKISLVTGELAETKDKLDETKQVLAIVGSERTDLIGKCRGFESSIESLVIRLGGEQQQHEQTKLALHVARDGNANEARRAELETANCGLEQRCKDLVDELSQSKNRERLLLNTNRALEARLGDALRKLDDPTRPEDILTDHRRIWDSQLIECRKETADTRRRLEVAESDLVNERLGADVLRRRVRELEMVVGQQRGDQSVKKRRLEAAIDCEDAGFVVVTPIRNNCLRSHSYDATMTTPSRGPPPILADGGRSSAVVRSTLTANGGVDCQLVAEYSSSEMQQTLVVVDAGEHARDRRRKNDSMTRTAEQMTFRRASNADMPVTPRIGLRTTAPSATTTPLGKQSRG